MQLQELTCLYHDCPVYICPQNKEVECAVHGGFDTCCGDPTCPSKTLEIRERVRHFNDLTNND